MNNAFAQYNRDAVLAATPARLLTMLYDRLLLDLARAARAQQAGDWTAASAQLLHAQDIVAELSSTLRVDLWEGAKGLLALYTYVANGLRIANIHRDPAPTLEAITLLEPIAAAWQEAIAQPVGGGVTRGVA